MYGPSLDPEPNKQTTKQNIYETIREIRTLKRIIVNSLKCDHGTVARSLKTLRYILKYLQIK